MPRREIIMTIINSVMYILTESPRHSIEKRSPMKHALVKDTETPAGGES